MDYIIHACGSPIYLDISNLITLVSRFGVTPKGLKIGVARFGEVKNKRTADSKFFCCNCGTEVTDRKQLQAICLDCGKYFPINECYFLSKSGGSYCNEHSVKEGEERIPLTTIIENVSL